MNYENRFGGANFDVGTGVNISLNQVKDIVQNYFANVEFKYVKSRPGEVQETKADVRPLSDLGWNTEIAIKDGIEECFRELSKTDKR